MSDERSKINNNFRSSELITEGSTLENHRVYESDQVKERNKRISSMNRQETHTRERQEGKQKSKQACILGSARWELIRCLNKNNDIARFVRFLNHFDTAPAVSCSLLDQCVEFPLSIRSETKSFNIIEESSQITAVLPVLIAAAALNKIVKLLFSSH